MTVLASLVGPVTELVGKFVEDKDQKNRLAHDLETLVHKEMLAQMMVNAKEAEHPSVFVAGWRPAVGWICALAMGFNFIVVPLANFTLILLEVDTPIPALDLSVMSTVLMGMLGIGGMRSFEKVKKVGRNNLKKNA